VYRFKNHIAIFLLLLFTRVLAPETAVLALHSHEHTEEQPTKEAGFKMDKKHQHCQADHLFNAPFTPGQPVSIKPIPLSFTGRYSANYSDIWKFTFPNNTDLRGPPAV
jgi:hypothetical protein